MLVDWLSTIWTSFLDRCGLGTEEANEFKPGIERKSKWCWGDMVLEMNKDTNRRRTKGGQGHGKLSSQGSLGCSGSQGFVVPPTSQAAILTSLSFTVSPSPASHSTLLLFPAESTLAHKPLPKHPSLLFTGHTLFIHRVIHIFCSHCIQNLCE